MEQQHSVCWVQAGAQNALKNHSHSIASAFESYRKHNIIPKPLCLKCSVYLAKIHSNLPMCHLYFRGEDFMNLCFSYREPFFRKFVYLPSENENLQKWTAFVIHFALLLKNWDEVNIVCLQSKISTADRCWKNICRLKWSKFILMRHGTEVKETALFANKICFIP